MERIIEGATGLEASNIIYSNDSYLRTLNVDAKHSASDGVRAFLPKPFSAVIPQRGFSPIDAVMSAAYHPVLRIVTNTAGAANILAVRGATVLNSVEVVLAVGDNFIDSTLLGDFDARIYVEFKVAALVYDNSPVYSCFEYDKTTGEVIVSPYDIGVYVVALASAAFANNPKAYPFPTGKVYQTYTTHPVNKPLAYGYNRQFLNYADAEAIELFSLVPSAIAIHYVRVSDSAVFKILNLNTKAGYNYFNLLDWLDLNATVSPFYILVQFKDGALAFSNDDTGIGVSKDVVANTAVVASGAQPAFRILVKDVLGLSEAAKRGTFGPSGVNDAYSFYYADAAITSAKRLKALNVYAVADGQVFIDFIALASAGYASVSSGYANYTQEYYPVKKGWNRLENIKVPNFKGTAYVAIRAVAGVLAYQSATTGMRIMQKTGAGAPTLENLRFLYNIETYDFDIMAVASGSGNVQLPSGTIEFSNKLALHDTHLIGAGVENTWLRFTGTSDFAVALYKSGLSNLTLIGESTIKTSVPTLFTTLAEVQNLTGLNQSGTSGVGLVTSPCSIHDIKIKDFDFKGFENAAAPNGDVPRGNHNQIGQIDITGCGIGYDILQAGEYSPMALVHASNCGIGIRICAGNVFTSASTFNDNAVGLYMYKAGNDAHGSFTACNWNHSKKWAMILDTISHGETFVGCHVFEGAIYLYRALGFNWTGGIIDAPIMAQGGKTQSLSYTAFQSAYWNKAGGILHNYNGETDYLKMHGNFFMFETGADDGILNNV